MAAKGTRKRHVQQQLFRRGGKRRGAGRKPTGARAGVRHGARKAFDSRHPLHIVIRAVPEIGSLRCGRMYKAIRRATSTAATRGRFRIVHVSVQRTHVHLLVEAEDKQALGRGMQGFQISAARNINTALAVGGRRRCGKVFADRYHASVIGSPRQARNALAYVLSNFRKHREDREGVASTWLVDPFSTAILFTDWMERGGRAWPIREGYEPLIVCSPRTWLLAEGWKRAGAISVFEVPSRKH